MGLLPAVGYETFHCGAVLYWAEIAAPRATPAARPAPGTNRLIPVPTAREVARTSPMDRLITTRRFFRMASREELSAAL